MGALRNLWHFLHAGWVLSREGVFASFPAEDLEGGAKIGYKFVSLLARKKAKTADRAQNLMRALHRLGPSYIKLGQFLATRPDIMGQTLCEDLSQLQDRVATFSQAEAIAQIEQSLGKDIHSLFVEFGPPIAAASMAQVHPAMIRRPDGSLQKVAVKVIRPNVRRRFHKDLESFFFIAKLQERYIKKARRLRPVEVVKALRQTTRLELDLRLEAAALSEMHENSVDDMDFRVPFVDWQRTGRDVLTMEWIDGIKISESAQLDAAGFDRNLIATRLMQSFLRHALRDGFFHADMHPGNLFVDKEGRIVAVDLGITGRLSKKEQNFLAEILYGFINRDYQRVAAVHFEAGYVPRSHNMAYFAQANRAIGEPIHGQSAQTISMSKLLLLLFEITNLFDMETRPELLLLQKTMVVVEGVTRKLDPNFNMWRAADPVVRQWMYRNMGPEGIVKEFQENGRVLRGLIRRAPEALQSLERLIHHADSITENGLHLNEHTLERLAYKQQNSRKSLSYALWILVACFVAITLKFCLH